MAHALPMNVLGCDGGANGAVALLRVDVDRRIALEAWGPLSDPEGMVATLRRIVGDRCVDVAFVEGALSIPADKGRLRSVAVYHQAVGALRAAAGEIARRVVVVEPQTWQRASGHDATWKTGSTSHKNAIAIRAREGIAGAHIVPLYAADSLAIARYGVRELLAGRTA